MKKYYIFMTVFLLSLSAWGQRRETMQRFREQIQATPDQTLPADRNTLGDDKKGQFPEVLQPGEKSANFLFQESFEGEFPTPGWSFYPQPIIHPYYNNSYMPIEVGPLPDWYLQDLDITAPPGGGEVVLWASPHFDGLPGESNEKWVISPEITINMPSTLVFWTRNGICTLNNLDVMVSTTGDSPEAFTELLGTHAFTNTEEWTMHTYDLLPYLGQSIRVGFRNHIENNMWHGGWLFIDMVSVIENLGAPECAERPFPADALENINPFNAKLSWDATGATSYEVYLGTSLPGEPSETVQQRWYIPQLEANTSYEWKVVPKSTMGEAQNCPTWSFSTGDITPEYFLNNSEAVTAAEGYFYDSGGPEKAYNLNDDHIKTFYPENPGARLRFSFSQFSLEINWDKLFVYDGTSTDAPQVPGSPFSDGAVPIMLKDLVATNPEGALTFHLVADDINSWAGWQAWFTEFTPQDYSLDLKYLAFDKVAAQNDTLSFSAVIQNEGLQDIETFSLKLTDVLSGEVFGVFDFEHPIPAGGIAEVSFSKIFTQAGNFQLQVVPMVNGSSLASGSSDPRGFNVLENHSIGQVGEPEIASVLYPYNLAWEKSVLQVIYMADEIGRTGNISAIGFLKHLITDYSFPVKIWVGETQQSKMEGQLIDVSTHQLVFDGNALLDAGYGYMTNLFEEPFSYQGNNLVVTILREYEEQTYHYEANQMFHQETPQYPDRSAGFFHDSFYLNSGDPLDPGQANLNIQSIVPATVFYFSDESVGGISGQVRIGSESGPVAPNVEVSIHNTLLSTITDEAGGYAFPKLHQGIYGMKLQSFGYQDIAVQEVLVEDGQETLMNFVLQELPRIAVSGKITSSGDPVAGLEGAMISLQGYQDYEAVSGPDGLFTISEVFGQKTYSLIIKNPGFQDYSAEINPEDNNLDLGILQMDIIPYAPLFASAAETEEGAIISWASDYYNGFGLEEDFEGEFPGQGWTTVITNPGENYMGQAFHWQQHGIVEYDGYYEIPVISGEKQVGVMPDFENGQNEWLITPPIKPLGSLTFWMFGYMGSESGDANSVAVSTDNGESWTVLWDASQETPGWNYYDTPIEIDLSAYQGQDIRIAFVARGPVWDGVVYGLETPWFIDNVSVGIHKLNPENNHWEHTTSRSNPLAGYSLFRFTENQPQENWEMVASEIQDTLYLDSEWSTLPYGIYQYAIKAVYTDGQASAFTKTNKVFNKMSLDVPVQIATSSGLPSEGAKIWFFHEELPGKNQVFTYSPEEGFLAQDLWRGPYQVTITKSGFETLAYGSFEVTEDAFLQASLTEKMTPASNLAGETSGSSSILSWEKETQTDTLSYVTGEILDGYGGVWEPFMEVAIRITPSELAEHDLKTLKKVAFHSFFGQANYTIVIRQGGTLEKPSEPILIQQVTNVIPEAWNVVELENEILVDGTRDLWIGLEMEIMDNFVIGVDEGPAQNGYGNLVRQGAGFITSLDLHGTLDFNWAIRAMVSDLPHGIPEGENTSRQFLVFRNDEQIAQVGGDTYTFQDQGLLNGTYTYYLIADYAAGQTGPSNTITLEVQHSTVGIDNPLQDDNFHVYPIPARNTLNLEFPDATRKLIQLTDLSGRIKKEVVSHSAFEKLNVSDLPEGIYLLKILSNQSVQSRKISIVR